MHRDDSVFVALEGEFDISRTAELRDSLLAGNADRDVVVDLTLVRFMDSTSLRALLEVRVEFERKHSTLTLVNPSPAIARLFSVTQLGGLFGLLEEESSK